MPLSGSRSDGVVSTRVVDDVKTSALTMDLRQAIYPAHRRTLWVAVMTMAVAMRLVFYTGYFGSDEVTYVESAIKLLHGDWAVSDYVGSNRYGMNLPIAGFALLFGQHEWSAAAYSMMCSLLEIALVFGVGRRLVGDRPALLAAVVLASLPTHVHLAGRLMADSPLALTLTASFLFFFDGELRRNRVSYFIAGLAAGFSFWVKQATIFYLLVFLLYPIVFRRWDRRWFWMVGGFAVAVLLNCLLFLLLTGDALFMLKAMKSRQTSGYLEKEAVRDTLGDSPLFYVSHLFAKVHHTWLLAPLALVGLWKGRSIRHARADGRPIGVNVIAFWAIGLISVLSLLPISWRPLMFVPKQTNYMLMFVAPLALLAGCGLAHLRGRWLGLALAVVIVPSILLSALHQSSIHAFTANAKAAAKFASEHPGERVFGNSNPQMAGLFHNLVKPDEPPANILPMADLFGTRGPDSAAATLPGKGALVVVDLTTLRWGTTDVIRKIEEVPKCWVVEAMLTPMGMGLGWHLQDKAAGLLEQWRLTALIPPIHRLHASMTPDKALVFRVAPGCR